MLDIRESYDLKRALHSAWNNLAAKQRKHYRKVFFIGVARRLRLKYRVKRVGNVPLSLCKKIVLFVRASPLEPEKQLRH